MAARSIPDRMIVGISGASGVVYGITALQLLRASGIETHLVLTGPACRTLAVETNITADEVMALADHCYPPDDVGAAIASGSLRSRGMLVAPCSVKTLAQIATGTCDNLLARCADVTLKERRRLVLMVRETPLTLTHLRNMASVTENGGIVAPPVPAFYAQPHHVSEIVAQSVGRVLDLFDIDVPGVRRWGEAWPRSPTS